MREKHEAMVQLLVGHALMRLFLFLTNHPMHLRKTSGMPVVGHMWKWLCFIDTVVSYLLMFSIS